MSMTLRDILFESESEVEVSISDLVTLINDLEIPVDEVLEFIVDKYIEFEDEQEDDEDDEMEDNGDFDIGYDVDYNLEEALERRNKSDRRADARASRRERKKASVKMDIHKRAQKKCKENQRVTKVAKGVFRCIAKTSKDRVKSKRLKKFKKLYKNG